MGWLDKTLMILAAVGALNWGLVGLKSFGAIDYSWDLVSLIFSGLPWLAAIIYLLIAISGVWVLIRTFQD